MESKRAAKGQKQQTEKVYRCLTVSCFVSLTVPGAQLVLVQPFGNDAGHLHNVG